VTTSGPVACGQSTICVVCGGLEFRPFWPKLKQCVACGHVVADLDVCSIDFEQVYDEGYFTGEEYGDYLRDRPVFVRQFEDRLREVFQFARSGHLIEIGSAYGFFLDAARAHFVVRGFDICAGPVRYAREQLGLNVACEDFSPSSVEADSADVVAMWDTIEHLPRPDLTLEAAVHALRPGGHLFLTTGDVGSLLARRRKEKWRLVHPPTHLHYFSQDTIQRLFRRLGLEPVLVKYVGTRRSVGQVAFSLLQLNRQKPSRLYQLVMKSGLGRVSFVLNTRDIMLVVGRKRVSGEFRGHNT